MKIGTADSEITRGKVGPLKIKKKTSAEHVARGAGMPRGQN